VSVAGFERVMRRADRGLARLEAAQIAEARRYLTQTLRVVLLEAERAYRLAIADIVRFDSGASFRLARSLVLIDELEATLARLGDETRLARGLAGRIAEVRGQAAEMIAATLEHFGEAVTISTPINHRAVASVVTNAQDRLRLHGVEAIDRIKQRVTTGIARGSSWQRVARGIREDTGYLARRAETIARTELHSAQADARREVYAVAGVELVIRYVTLDDRTCEICAPRQGEIQRADEAIEVLHPNCRCVLAPVRPEWVDAGTMDPDELETMRRDSLALLEESGGSPRYGAAPFERDGKIEAVWRPGQSTDRIWRAVGGRP
jgi:SPP1 gp7 family putative phage head morphogenesis protein